MNRNASIILIFAALALTRIAAAATEAIKLPYEAGERFVVVQGYDSPPTHVGKDLYAIDFSQDGCDAYGKFAVASAAGTVLLAQDGGYNGGYGTQVLVVNGSRIVARYAHMIPGSVAVTAGDTVEQGEPLGDIGNTGLVAGFACPIFPGTHLHFAMYGEAEDGSFSPYRPEPISNYVGITAGRWYLSDNGMAIDTVPGATAIIDRTVQAIVGNSSGPSSSASSPASALPSVSFSVSSPAPAGGVSASPPLPPASTSSTVTSLTTSSTAAAATTSPSLSITDASFNSTTLAIDLAWQVSTDTTSSSAIYEIFYSSSTIASLTASSSPTLVATTTATSFSYPLTTDDLGLSLQFAVELEDVAMIAMVSPTISLPDWYTTIQPRDDETSNGSWYDDNWYDLGTGFYGTIRSLTVEGAVNSSNYGASHFYLDEYLDAAYTELNQSWTLSDDAPFVNGFRKVTIDGLDIALQPNKYYRLRTYQDYQNRSVILEGTSVTGTAMWDEFIGGTGRVEHNYPFYPYLAGIMIPDYPPLQPPAPVATMTIAFDSLSSNIDLSWPPTTDPDTTSSLLAYQLNITTSTEPSSGSSSPAALDPAGWQSVGKKLRAGVPVVFGDSYLIGLRAVDDLGNTSTPLITPWNFPAGYFPIPQQLDASVELPDGAQSFAFPAPITIASIAFVTKSDPNSAYCCAVSVVNVRADARGTPGAVIATSDEAETGYADPRRERTYLFSPAITLPAGTYWFEVAADTTPNNDATYVFGSASDSYAGGAWSSAPGQDAYFRIQE